MRKLSGRNRRAERRHVGLLAGFDYCVKVHTAAGQVLRWPATAPALNQSVVVLPTG